MAYFADILNVIYLYSHSLRGSTVLPAYSWLRHRVFIHFIHRGLHFWIPWKFHYKNGCLDYACIL